MTVQEASQLIDQLSILKFFPAQPNARAALVVKLMGWCRGTDRATPLDQAEWLIDAATELDEYPGPKTLHTMLVDKFYPAGAMATYQGPKPTEIECHSCNDTGTIQDLKGVHDWCTCKAADGIRADLPDWLATLNRFRAVPARRKEKLTTAQFESRIGL